MHLEKDFVCLFFSLSNLGKYLDDKRYTVFYFNQWCGCGSRSSVCIQNHSLSPDHILDSGSLQLTGFWQHKVSDLKQKNAFFIGNFLFVIKEQRISWCDLIFESVSKWSGSVILGLSSAYQNDPVRWYKFSYQILKRKKQQPEKWVGRCKAEIKIIINIM